MASAKKFGGEHYDDEAAERGIVIQEAAEWLVAMDDDSEPFDEPAFLAWLGASPQHVREFLLLSAISNKVKSLRPR